MQNDNVKLKNFVIRDCFGRPRNDARRGEVLMESLIAITIAVVGILGMFNLLSRSLSLTRVISDRYIAANLGQEGVEIVKNIIDTNILQNRPWNQGLQTGFYEVEHDSGLETDQSRNLFYNPESGFYSYDKNGAETKFKRQIRVERIGAEEIKAEAIMKWTSRGGATFEEVFEDHFLNWQ